MLGGAGQHDSCMMSKTYPWTIELDPNPLVSLCPSSIQASVIVRELVRLSVLRVLHFTLKSTSLESAQLHFWCVWLQLIIVRFCNNLHKRKQMRWVNWLPSLSLIYFRRSWSPSHPFKVYIFLAPLNVPLKTEFPFRHRCLAWLTQWNDFSLYMFSPPPFMIFPYDIYDALLLF